MHPYRQRRGGPVAALILALLLPAGAAAESEPAAEASPPEPTVLRYENGTLSARVQRTPLTDVLRQLSEVTGAEIAGGIAEPREVSGTFENVPLDEGLRRLLGDTSFLLVYCDGGRLCRVSLLEKGQDVVMRAPAPVAPTPPAEDPTLTALGQTLDAHPPVAADPALANVIGGDQASLRQLVYLALTSHEGAVRAAAVRSGVKVLDAEPELRSQLLGILNGLTPEAVTAMIGGNPARAREALEQLRSQSQNPEVRAGAEILLR